MSFVVDRNTCHFYLIELHETRNSTPSFPPETQMPSRLSSFLGRVAFNWKIERRSLSKNKWGDERPMYHFCSRSDLPIAYKLQSPMPAINTLLDFRKIIEHETSTKEERILNDRKTTKEPKSRFQNLLPMPSRFRYGNCPESNVHTLETGSTRDWNDYHDTKCKNFKLEKRLIFGEFAICPCHLRKQQRKGTVLPLDARGMQCASQRSFR